MNSLMFKTKILKKTEGNTLKSVRNFFKLKKNK